MNLLALQGLLGGVAVARDGAASNAPANRAASAETGPLSDGVESGTGAFAALLELAVEQQPAQETRAGFDFGLSGLKDGEASQSQNTDGKGAEGAAEGRAPESSGAGDGEARPRADAQRPPLGVTGVGEEPLRAGARPVERVPLRSPQTVPSKPVRGSVESTVGALSRAGAADHGLSPAEGEAAPSRASTAVEHSAPAWVPERPVGDAERSPAAKSSSADEPVFSGVRSAAETRSRSPVSLGRTVATQTNAGVPLSREQRSVSNAAQAELTLAPEATRGPEVTVGPEAVVGPEATVGPDPDRDLRRLDPRLRVAVTRVLRRLDKEFGIDAKVAEAYRTEDRQKTLYAQGRTLPGRVVTWTLDSAHTRGRAVDLILNGQWTDLEPYRVLQMVAQEEGLHTLGMKDPGHLQLPDSAKPMRIARVEPDAVIPAPEASAEPRRRRPVRRQSGLAFTARVAGVAGRASVAQAAAPAVPGRGGLTGGRSINLEGSLLASSGSKPTPAGETLKAPASPSASVVAQSETPLPPTPKAVAEPQLEGSMPGVASEGFRQPSTPETRAPEPRLAAPAPTADVGPSETAPTGVEGREATASSRSQAVDSREPVEPPSERSAVRPSEPGSLSRSAPIRSPAASGMAGRVEQIQALQEAAQSRAPGMRVDLGDVDGSGTRVRLDLRGGKVDAHIEVNDPALGNNLERRVNSLRAALESRGLEPETLQVRTVAEEPGVSTRLNSLDSSTLLDSDSREPKGRNPKHSDPSKDLPRQGRQDEPGQKGENDSKEGRNETRGRE